ncbi:MAG: MerR family DNA-binding protein, partial [Bryobacteraceae bacterium]
PSTLSCGLSFVRIGWSTPSVPSGFRLDEMRQLLNGFHPSVAASRRWQELTQKKMRELDEQIATLNAMRKLVGRVRECECVDLSDCGRIAWSVIGTVSN